jgi:hypothetical protein
MSDDAQRWKEKYLKSIEQQDKLERRWAAVSTCCAAVWYAVRWPLKAPTGR